MIMPTARTFEGFEEEKRIKDIPNNKYLTRICNHILDLYKRKPDIIENSESVGEINARITLALWHDEGLGEFISEDKREAFYKWFTRVPNPCPPEDAVSRAMRYLVNDLGLIKLPAKVIINAERHRVRISESFKK